MADDTLNAIQNLLRKSDVTDAVHEYRVHHLFPHSGWLASSGFRRDSYGYITPDRQAEAGRLTFETSKRDIFAIGDVRAESTKRDTAEAGDGAQVISAFHDFICGNPPMTNSHSPKNIMKFIATANSIMAPTTHINVLKCFATEGTSK